MRAFQIVSPHSYRFLDDLDVPTAGVGEVLLRIEKLGFCGSDLNTFRGKNPMVSYPRIPGHEIVGTIAEIGADVPSHIRVGEVVTVTPYTSCGVCSACREGRENACKNNQTLGVQRDGGFREYIVVPYRTVLTDISDLPLQSACLIEPLAVGFHAAQRGAIRRGDCTLVFGCGMVGIGAVAAGRRRGATVIAVDIDDAKLDLAQKAGAEFVINSAAEDLAQRILEITHGDGPAVCIEAVGLAETFRSAVDVAAFCGRVVYVGYAKQPVSYDTKLFVMKELDIRGSRNATREDFREALEALRSGAIPTNELITRDLKFEEAGAGLEYWDEHSARVSKILVSLA
ncbi:MAG: zinc-binding alcohol dehydrogenase family protein [Spirochaetales bacterium]|nr:zinc-binding alcohol dehydrogenase family protein [Spirochaetales bacterium]